jgi:hypothetical protein
MGAYIPPGWPAGVHPPGSDEFESTAVGWLLDVVPPDYRLHGVLRRYPVALATMARYHSKACVEGARQGYRTARTDLAGVLPPHAIDTVLAAYRKEGARLAATAQAVDLVERALRGEVFTPKMSPAPAVPTAEEARAGEAKTGGTRNGGTRAEEARAGGTRAGSAKAAERRATGVKAAEQKGTERQGAKAKGTVTQAADAETQAAEVKTAETQGAEAQGAEARAAEKKAARGKATASGQSRAGARRNSADRGRSDLART